MPRYLFHLSFGDRTWPDEEGFEFPSRAAAREEAAAVIRDLSDRRSEKNSRRWAGWFLHIADADGEFLSLPIGHPALSVVLKEPQSQTAKKRAAHDRLARVAREVQKCRRHTQFLLEKNRRLREELASELTRAECAGIHVHELLSRARIVNSTSTDARSS